MKKKYYIITTMTWLIVLASLFMLGSFAFYQKTENQTNQNNISSGCFNIQFEEFSNSIKLNNTYPITDTQGLNQKPYTFKITNTCDIAANYMVTLNTVDIANNIPDKNIKVSIDKVITKQIKSLTNFSINADTSVLKLYNLKQSYILDTDILNAGESTVYDLNIWIDENADNSIENKNMEAAIAILSTVSKENNGQYLINTMMNQFGGRNEILTANNDLFIDASTEKEAKMYKTEDNYGKSYYLRGAKNLLNNNIIFANMQWKIVRINGDGSIRLIYNGTCPNNTCTINSIGDDTQILSLSAYNSSYDDNAYVGYMHGTKGAGDYNTTHKNEIISTINEFLNTWYENNLKGKTYETYLSDTLFCNDRDISDGTLGYGTNITYYSSYTRLNTNRSPSLICSQKNDRFTVNDITIGNGNSKYPIGLISIDEIAFAGGRFNTTNNSFYLYNAKYYWTSSPSHFSGTYSMVWYVFSGGGLSNSYVNTSMGVRPVINLNSTTRVTGTGSEIEPYIVI